MTADKQSTSTHIILTNINWQVTNKKNHHPTDVFSGILESPSTKHKKIKKLTFCLPLGSRYPPILLLQDSLS